MKTKLLIVSLISLLVVLLAGLILVRYYFTNLIRVPQAAMANNIIPGDQLIVTRWCFGEMERGTVVTFQYPGDSTNFVARVIGLPGEAIQVKGDQVFINDQPLNEKRTKARENRDDDLAPLEELTTEGVGSYQVFLTRAPEESWELEVSDAVFGTLEPFRLDQNSYFMLGDNRYNAMDSRHRGPVPKELIWGRVKSIYFSAHPVTQEIRSERSFKRVN